MAGAMKSETSVCHAVPILGALTIGLVLASVPACAISADPPQPALSRRHQGPTMRTPDSDPDAHASTGAHDATNPIWAGYVVTGSDFTMVQGSWIVHGVDCDQTPNANSSEWVGLDGYNDPVITSPTVEQTGTDADCANGTPSYYVWYEFFPDGVAVVPSDIVSI